MRLKRKIRNTANNLLKFVNVEVVKKSELDALRRRCGLVSPNGSRTLPIPKQLEHQLHINHPRLLELRDCYKKATLPVLNHSQWNRELVATEIDLQYFRDDSAFVFQNRDLNNECNYLLTTYYVKSIDRLNLLARLDEDEQFGVQVFRFNDEQLMSRDLLDSIVEIYFLEDTLHLSQQRDFKILDIGAGYGRFAHRMAQAFSGQVKTFCVDAIPESTFLCEIYLRFRSVENWTQVVPLDQIEETVEGQHIDLAINIHSFSECTLQTVCGWLDFCRKYEITYLMIVPNAEKYLGKKLLTTECEFERIDYLPEIEKRNYQLVNRQPKYLASSVQRHGVSPTWHYLFKLNV